MAAESRILGFEEDGVSESFIDSDSLDVLRFSELAVSGLVSSLSSTPESWNPFSYITKKSSTLRPSSFPHTDVRELLFVKTLLLSVPLVPI
jgi:hypothetical protein